MPPRSIRAYRRRRWRRQFVIVLALAAGIVAVAAIVTHAAEWLTT